MVGSTLTLDAAPLHRDNTRMSEQQHPTTRQLVAQIAEALGETAPQPLEQIRRLITVMGTGLAQELLRDTQVVEAAGGLFLGTSTDSRCRLTMRCCLDPPIAEPHPLVQRAQLVA